MRIAAGLFVLLLTVAATSGQELSRAQKLQKIDELNGQIRILEKDVIAPSSKDFMQAQKEGVDVFRIMPREKYDGKLTMRGGGAYYSFVQKRAEYGNGSDIELAQNHLTVGFAGANYGFLYDLGETPLADISKETSAAAFLLNYKPPAAEPEIRREQRRAHDYDANGVLFKNRLPSIVGHTYLVRSINFGSSDILVAFKVHRTDADGSQIILWKSIADFPIAQIERNSVVVDSPQISEAKADAINYEMVSALQNNLIQKELTNVTVEATNKAVTLRGSVPKGRMADAVRTAQEIAKRPVKNELAEYK